LFDELPQNDEEQGNSEEDGDDGAQLFAIRLLLQV